MISKICFICSIIFFPFLFIVALVAAVEFRTQGWYVLVFAMYIFAIVFSVTGVLRIEDE
jgi:hypothetical protein